MSSSSEPRGLSRRVRADLLLLLVAVIWGSAFVVQRIAAGKIGLFQFTGLRFFLAGLVLLPFAVRRGRPLPGTSRWVLLATLILFVASNLQQAGLRYTTAGNAGFITTLYVVLIPLILVVFFRQKLHLSTWISALLAVIGLYLLSMQGSLKVNPGDGLELIGAIFWALHIIVLGMAVQKVEVLHLAVGQYLLNGIINLALGLTLESGLLAGLRFAWWPVLYTGLISVAVGYTVQTLAQRDAPPADAAILLSMESVFAALSGFLFLSEQLTALQLFGCALILLASLLVQFWRR